MQLDPLRAVVVDGREQAAVDPGLDAELFAKLPAQAVFLRLAGLDLPARELPEPREVRALDATRDEVRAITLDDGGGNDDGRSHEAATNGSAVTCAVRGGEAATAIAVPGSAASRAT